MLPPGSWGPHGTSRSGFSTRLKAPPARPINPTHPFPDGLLQKRMVKYQDKLFTFIRHDGVPWNNNNAENAIKRFAYYREDTVGIMREAGLNDYLMLLSLYVTCRYKGISFLNFLLSKERDIDAFFVRPRIRQRKPDLE